jgi:hypothetical protein
LNIINELNINFVIIYYLMGALIILGSVGGHKFIIKMIRLLLIYQIIIVIILIKFHLKFNVIMEYCPSIILNKIYWYLWRLKNRDLCIEYHKRVISIYHKVYFDLILYNYRNMDMMTNFNHSAIYSITMVDVGHLPKNY